MREAELGDIAQRYQGMSEGELMKIAREYDHLSEPAQKLLREEFSRRSLQPPLVDDPDPEEGSEQERTLVTIRKYRDLPEAFIARSVLESAGVKCFLQDENTVRMDWLWSNVIGGARLQVAARDVSLAEEILSQPIPASFPTDAGVDFEQPRCPQCGSLDVDLNDTDRRIAAATVLVLGIPLNGGHPTGGADGSRILRCLHCGCKWYDDEAADPDGPAPVH